MKIRKGFVSNSSSSSFVCDVTGEVYEGYDAGLSEFDLCECKKGHVFPDDYIPSEIKERFKDEEDEMFDEDWRYTVPEKYCPICNGEAKPKIVSRLKKEMEHLLISVEDLK